jgi:cytoskeletal protein RodZ
MSEKKQESFTVTDRRLFTADGEVRQDISEEQVSTSAPPPASPSPAASSSKPSPTTPPSEQDGPMPPAPTAAEQQTQADAYRKSSKDLDSRVEQSGHSAKELEMTFERFMASLYMSAMMHLGLMQEEGGQPRLDLIGARQTIDTLNLLSEKTKGNLTSAEANFLQNCLYELRMAYVEVTNALARPPQAAGAKPSIR